MSSNYGGLSEYIFLQGLKFDQPSAEQTSFPCDSYDSKRQRVKYDQKRY